MSLRDVNVEKEYRTLGCNIAHDFYIPLLNNATEYNRAVGFFSSSILARITEGISGLVKNEGHIKLIASPYLSNEDIEAMRKGYEERKIIIKNALFKQLLMPQSKTEAERLNLLATLIANGTLDIKIAYTESGMYHEKLGIIKDTENNIVAFSGSMNESLTAIESSYEVLDVFTSWNDPEERAKEKYTRFNSIWNGTENNLTIIDFPELKNEVIKQYRKHEVNYEIIRHYDDELMIRSCVEEDTKKVKIPKSLTLYDYQKNAISEWKKNDYKGIYNMATGTGKTFTALSSIAELYNNINGGFCVIILCPYIHLVNQWIEDIEKFNIKPIIAFSDSPQKNWKEKLDRAVFNRNNTTESKGFFCLVSTIDSFKGKFIQNKINQITKSPILLVADEAHNLGANTTKQYLQKEKYKYRLALSATMNRHFDIKGTEFLYNFFEKECISYGLKQAIDEKHLVPYKYYPIIVTLNDDEKEQYCELSRQITLEIRLDSESNEQTLSEKGKRLCIKRSRIVAGAENKILTLIRTIEPYKNKNMILIYCGAVKYDNDKISGELDENDKKQITTIIKELYDKYEMKITKFTAQESAEERKTIIQKFSEGKDLQCIAAIKCLDEGVNIPSIKTAFILASSTNPKEYIQRRGRVLRKFEGKEFAEIYDFVTLPYSLETIRNKTFEENNYYKSLATNETRRMTEFADLALNKYDSMPYINVLKESFDINKITQEEILENE